MNNRVRLGFIYFYIYSLKLHFLLNTTFLLLLLVVHAERIDFNTLVLMLNKIMFLNDKHPNLCD